MIVLYKIGVLLYVAGIYLASFFNRKAALWISGRENWRVNLENTTKEWSNSVWFHCASLGEFEMIRPLVEKIKSIHPSQKIVISFFSPSGYEVRKNYNHADLVVYLPVDSAGNAEFFLKCIRPVCAVFAKYEFWHFFIDELKKNKISMYVVSAVFREDHRFFKWYGKFFRNDLKKFTAIFVQDNHSSGLLKRIGIDSIVTGDTRFDRVIELSSQAKKLPSIEKFIDNRKVIIAGSSWEPEEVALQKLVNDLSSDFCLIIAPHDISSGHLKKIEALFPESILFSQLAESRERLNVLIIDNIGMLGSLYQYGCVAVIGGGFTGKLHNILEAAVYGNVVMFGPLHSRFHEAQNMINAGGAIEFTDGDQLQKNFTELFSDPQKFLQMRKNAKEFIFQNSGAVNIIFPALEKNLKL